MSRLLNRLIGRAMGTFVAQGVAIDERGRLLLPDGLTADRVQRFIELCLDRSFASPRDAMHALFARVGVRPRAIDVLNRVVHEGGDLDMGAVTRNWRALAGELAGLQAIPTRFRDFLVLDLGLADPRSRSLEQAVASTRRNAARRLGCSPDWDQILGLPEGVLELTAAWRARVADAQAPGYASRVPRKTPSCSR